MAITDAKKVDYLWKKIGYGATKTDTNAAKKAPNEAIASPLLLRGDKTWNQANLIPATIPGSSAGVVTVYPTGTPDETTADGTATANRTWKTGLTDWIPPEFGSTYQVKVYIHTSSDAGNAAGSGDQVFATGSGNNDEWFFDYQSGVLHFIGSNLPNGISFSGKSVYISGARYTGTLGLHNNTADTGDFGFSGNKISTGSSNANMEFDTAGTGQYVFSADTGLVLPTGTTAQRPTAQEGVIRFNTTTGKYEVSQDGSTYTNLRTDHDADSITKDIFAGDGSTQTFTMSITPSGVENIVVYIDGVMQEPTQNYTISGTTIDFGEAAHAGARISVLHGFAD
tara:strand:- start:330 stop:1346 length:1017 start_codon:yes stop_codon:yes gene_type:complete